MRNVWVKIAQNTQLLKILSKALVLSYVDKEDTYQTVCLQSDGGLCFTLTESLDIIEYIYGHIAPDKRRC